MQLPRIEILPTKLLVGKHQRMSLANNNTFQLWQGFMPLRKHIVNSVTTDLISMQIFEPQTNSLAFNANTMFTKWAAVEVSDHHNIPEGLEPYVLHGGLYAVFIHQGEPHTFPTTWDYIFNTWIPKSDYELDKREHFEVLGEKYKNNHPNSEEEVWIPIRSKK